MMTIFIGAFIGALFGGVSGRGRVAEIADNRAATLDLVGADRLSGLDNTGPGPDQRFVPAHLCARHAGADAETGDRLANLLDARKSFDIDHELRVNEVAAHADQQVRPACEKAGVTLLAGHQGDSLAGARR